MKIETRLRHVADLVVKFNLTKITSINVTEYDAGIQLDVFELARVCQLLKVPKSKITTRHATESIQVSFEARSVMWCCCILADQQSQFFARLAELYPELTHSMRSLSQKTLALPHLV